MTLNTIRDLLRATPFSPFKVVMSNGEAYEIKHPEMAWLTTTNLLVGIDSTEEGVPSRFKICALLHIASAEPLETV